MPTYSVDAWQKRLNSLTPYTPNNGGDMGVGLSSGGGNDAYQKMITDDHASLRSQNKNAEDALVSKDYFPSLNNKIRGLPPIGFNKSGGYEPMALSDSSIGNAQDTMFKNSFPILAIRPVNLSKPANQSNVSNVVPANSEFYKFAIQNTGNTSYNITNSYGESQIENMMHQISNSTQFISDIRQFNQNNRTFNQMKNGLNEWTEGSFDSLTASFHDVGESLKQMLAPEGVATGKEQLFNAGANIAGALARTTMGEKIDIPNVWNGSSSEISQTVKIVLHCYDTSDENEYNFAILEPLNAILRLSSPFSESSSKTIGNDKDNDIITYENPPYVEAYIDGMFQTKLGAINNCSIDIPYNRISYYKRRPYIVNVSLTIVDMYNSLIYTNNSSYAPNAVDIIRNLRNPVQESATSPDEQVSEVYSKNWLQEPNSINAVGAIANAISSVGNAIGDIASTGGIINNIAAVGANAISGIIKQVIPTSMSSIASNANELLNKTSNSLLKNAKKSMVNTVVSGVNKIKSFF